MESFLKKVLMGRGDDESHRYFVRFGKGKYRRRFLIRLAKDSKIKIKASFEFANDFVKFAKEKFPAVRFSGKILCKSKVAGKEGRKKGGAFVYEVSECSIDEFENSCPYYYLLDANNSEMVLKIKKSLPKPGKEAEKIDDGFCSLITGEKYWAALKEAFFWDVPENAKKAVIEHELNINEIILPKGEKEPAKIREFAKRKGIIARKMTIDGKESVKEIPFEA